MSTSKTQIKSQSKSKVKPLYIVLGFLAVGVVGLVLYLVFGSSGNICKTGVSNQTFVYPEEESYAVPLETVLQCARKLGVPVSDEGYFPNTVTSGELASVMGEVCKKEGKGVLGLAFGNIRYSVVLFFKGKGSPLELVELPEGLFTFPFYKDPGAGDYTPDTLSLMASATYTSEDCPKTAVSFAGGAPPNPPLQLPVSGTQAPTASPAP